jgi:hypothetical protein
MSAYFLTSLLKSFMNVLCKKKPQAWLRRNEDVIALEMRFKKRMLCIKLQGCTVIELSTAYIETAQYRFLPTV